MRRVITITVDFAKQLKPIIDALGWDDEGRYEDDIDHFIRKVEHEGSMKTLVDEYYNGTGYADFEFIRLSINSKDK